MCPEPVQFRCRAAMRRPIDTCLDVAAHGTTKPRQLQCHLSEQRRDRVVTIVFHPANSIAAGANRPLDGVLPRLSGGDFMLNPREQLLGLREGQSQIGDIAEVIRLADLHDVHAGTLAFGYRQPQNPLHVPPPVKERERKYPAATGTPSFAPVPSAANQAPAGLPSTPRKSASREQRRGIAAETSKTRQRKCSSAPIAVQRHTSF